MKPYEVDLFTLGGGKRANQREIQEELSNRLDPITHVLDPHTQRRYKGPNPTKGDTKGALVHLNPRRKDVLNP